MYPILSPQIKNPDLSESRWALILGTHDDSSNPVTLSAEEKKLEDLLSALYGSGGEKGSLAKRPQKIRKWLEGVRMQFKPEIIRLMQQDALERQELNQMLLEPELLEQIEPDIEMVSAILALKELLPDKTRHSARMFVNKLVARTEKKLKPKLIVCTRSSYLGRTKRIHPASGRINWKRTIQQNLKNYQVDLKTIIPETWYGTRNGNRQNEIVLLVDKSESMIRSAIYASIIGAILASIQSIKTHLIFFDTAVTDMTDQFKDPVDILFSVPMGGGTDIGLALQYVQQKIHNPSRTVLFLISDLDEGGPVREMIATSTLLISKGMHMHCILAMDDSGQPEYHEVNGQKMADLGIPVFACAPELFPEVLADALNKIS